MLVVFVLLGLVTMLLFQATGLFANRYETVQRLHRESTVSGLQQQWFISTVQGLVAYGVEARRFRGEAAGFKGVTLQPLATEARIPIVVRWLIDEQSGVPTVVYREERSVLGDGVEWTVFAVDDPGLSFQYAGADGRWRGRWPVEDAPADWLPRAIRLLHSSNGTLWLAAVGTSAAPLITEADRR